jgi:hypothetical protein
MIQPRMMRRTGHVARMVRSITDLRFRWERYKKIDDWEEIDISGWIILK